MVRISLTKVISLFFVVCFLYIGLKFIFSFIDLPKNTSQDRKNVESFSKDVKDHNDDILDKNRNVNTDYTDWQPHKLAVIVPYRNRFEEMLQFVPWLHNFLIKQKIPHQIVIVNQIDSHRFNRASLINIGYLKTKDDCDYLVMHDIDLLPNNPNLLYTYPEKGPYHLASPEYHPMYHYKTYVGGVLMMTMEHFEMCRGMSNIFWGWGREDDELFLRFKEQKLKLYRPSGLTTGYQTFKHIHDKDKRPRDYKRYGDQKKTQFKRDYNTGFDTLQYKLESEKSLIIDGAPVKIYNVELHCDKSVTPWCDHEKT